MVFNIRNAAKHPSRVSCEVVVLFTAVLMGQLDASDSAKVDFTATSGRCCRTVASHCHGPDRKSKEAEETDLRLDLPESVFDEYGAIEPGDADASELMARITSPTIPI